MQNQEWIAGKIVFLKELGEGDSRFPMQKMYVNRKWETSNTPRLFVAIDGEDYGHMTKDGWDATIFGGMFCSHGFVMEYL